jgi:ketosteroid isomerase-like protein
MRGLREKFPMINISCATNAARRLLVAALCAFVFILASASITFAQNASELQMEGQKAVQAWVDAVVSGDIARIEAVLAPEFQILRADGKAYDKDAYLKSNLPRFPDVPVMSMLVVTGNRDLLVARYVLTTGGVLADGVERPQAPRLTVFRKDGDAWLVAAHANFAAVGR